MQQVFRRRATWRLRFKWTNRLLVQQLFVSTLVALPWAIVAGQSGPRAHGLGRAVASAPVPVATIGQLVELSTGAVLVSDPGKRVVILLDAALQRPRVVLDSAMGRANTFDSGIRSGEGAVSALWQRTFLRPFRSDTSLWFDHAAGVFVAISPNGSLGRTIAGPPVRQQSGTLNYLPYVSRNLGLVFKVFQATGSRLRNSIARSGAVADTTMLVEDSVKVVTMNFDSRLVDTVARFGTGSLSVVTVRNRSSSVRTTTGHPFPFLDDVAVTSDGAIVILHAQEYRIEWRLPNGSRIAGSRIPYPWKAITEPERGRLLDSVNAARRRAHDAALAQRVTDSAAAARTAGRNISWPYPPAARMAEDSEIPYYYPPVGYEAMIPDGDGNVWVRTVQGTSDPSVVEWDVVGRAGLLDRVRIPINLQVVGFGRGAVYVISRDAGVGTLRKYLVR
jgi:hypothetical protein